MRNTEIPVSVQIDRLKALRQDLQDDWNEAMKYGDVEMTIRKGTRIDEIDAKIQALEAEAK